MMFARTFTVLTLVGGLTLAAGSAHAGLLAEYTFNGGSDASTAGSPDATASTMTDAGSTDISSGTGTLFIRSNNTPTTDPGGLAAVSFAEFSITPTGPALNYDNITGSLEADAGNFWAAHYSVYTSTDGFSSNSVFHGTASDSSGGGSSPFDIDLSSLTNVAGTLTFRLVPTAEFFVNDDGEIEPATAGKIIRLDNVRVNGEVIPEPASAAMIGLGGLLILARRRRA